MNEWKEVTVFSMRKLQGWIEILEALATRFKITNQSDFSGEEYVIEYME